MKKAVCPKCKAKIKHWRGGIAICTEGKEGECTWVGVYPEYIEESELPLPASRV